MLRPMTDQELAPFEKGAPLMVERYRELRQAAEQLAAAGIAAQRSLKLARESVEKIQGQMKARELEANELAIKNTELEEKLEEVKLECADLRDERDRCYSQIEGLKDELRSAEKPG